MLNDPQPEQVPLQVKFRALVPGTTPDGTPSVLEVRQVCSGDLNQQGEVVIACGAEIVDIL